MPARFTDEYISAFINYGYPVVLKAFSDLFKHNMPSMTAALRAFLDECAPLQFLPQQQPVYEALSLYHSFSPPQADTAPALEVFSIGFGESPGALVPCDTHSLLCGMLSFMMSNDLSDVLLDLCQVPLAISKTFLFHQHGPNSSSFCFRQWFLNRFFSRAQTVLREWGDTSGCFLMSPEFLESVYLRVSHAKPLLSQPSDPLVNSKYASMMTPHSTADLSTIVNFRYNLRETPTLILTFYTYMMHKLAETMCHERNPVAAYNQTFRMLEPSMALLLRLQDSLTVSVLSRINLELLEKVDNTVQQMRDWLNYSPTAEEAISVHKMRAHSFNTTYVHGMHSVLAVLGTANECALEVAYAPAREVSLERFYAELIENNQVLQLHRVGSILPLDGVTAFSRDFGVWWLPMNVQIPVLECSVKIYEKACKPHVTTDQVIVGHSASGPYVFCSFATMHLLQIAMFAHSARARYFLRTTSMFQVMARLWISEHTFSPDPARNHAADLFARTAVIQVLARWLHIQQEGIMRSTGVPENNAPLLQSLHRIVCVLWGARPVASSETGFFDRLTALRNVLVLNEPHWIDVALLESIANGPGDAAELMRAMCAHLRETTYSVRTRTGKRDRGGAPLLYALASGEQPLRVSSSCNLEPILRRLRPDHPFRQLSTDALRSSALISAAYECALNNSPDVGQRVLLGMRTELPQLGASRYARALYACPQSWTREWSTQRVSSMCAPVSGRLYRPRQDVTAQDLTPFFTLLQQLDVLVCTKNRSAVRGYDCADSLAEHYMCPDRPHDTIPVSTYHNDDTGHKELVFFGSAMLLPELAIGKTFSDERRDEIRAQRSTFGSKVPTLADRGINLVATAQQFFKWTAHEAETGHYTLDAVRHYSQSQFSVQ